MNEDFLRWVGEKKLGGWCLSVCVCVCVSKHFRAQLPNGWSDRDRGGTDGGAETPERHWCRSRVGRRHVARGTCRRVKACKKNRTHLQVKRREPPIPNSQVTRIPPQLECFWGCRSRGAQAARARGGKLF